MAHLRPATDGKGGTADETAASDEAAEIKLMLTGEEIGRMVAFRTGSGLCRGGKDEHTGSTARGQKIPPGATAQMVGSIAAIQKINPGNGKQQVIAIAVCQHVKPAAARQPVISAAAIWNIAARRARQPVIAPAPVQLAINTVPTKSSSAAVPANTIAASRGSDIWPHTAVPEGSPGDKLSQVQVTTDRPSASVPTVGSVCQPSVVVLTTNTRPEGRPSALKIWARIADGNGSWDGRLQSDQVTTDPPSANAVMPACFWSSVVVVLT